MTRNEFIKSVQAIQDRHALEAAQHQHRAETAGFNKRYSIAE